MKTKSIDFNADLGEASLHEQGILGLISSANIGCGLHAGSFWHSYETLKKAKELKLRIGAHPGFADMANFGRKELALNHEQIKALLAYQIGALSELACLVGAKLSYIKPHGALYNMAARDFELASLIAKLCKAKNLALMGQNQLLKAAAKYDVASISEVFANRGYDDSGALLARGVKGAFLSDEEGVAQALCMIEKGYVLSVNQKKVEVKADSLCVHADESGALAFSQRLYSALKERGIKISCD